MTNWTSHWILALAAPALLFAAPLAAQERTAGGAIDAQMTWSSLSTQLGTTNSRITVIDDKINQAVTCAASGKVYGPGKPGADGAGCITVPTQPTIVTRITNLENQNNTNTGTINTANGNVNNVIYCAKQGLVFNGSGCASPASTARTPSCSISIAQVSSAANCGGGATLTITETRHSGSGGRGGSDYYVNQPYCFRVACN